MSEQLQFQPGSVKKAAQASGFRSSDLWKCPVNKLRVVEGFNVRDKDADYLKRVRYIANSIIENGYMDDKPIAGYVTEEGGQHFVIVTDGHTRYDAVQLVISEGHPIDEVPVVTKPRGTSMEDLTVALVTSNTGEKLRPFEVAKVCKRLIGYGMTEADIAKRIGLTRAYVIDLLALLAAPKAVRDMVSEGKVSATEAGKTIKQHGKKAVSVLTEALKSSSDGRATAKTIRKATSTVHPLVKKGVAHLLSQWNLEQADEHVEQCAVGLIAHLAGVPETDVSSYLTSQINSTAPSTKGSGETL